MKNYEKYADEINNTKWSDDFCENFVRPHILNSSTCTGISCMACQLKQMTWLLEEYKEPEELEVDWSKIEVDTPILVRDSETQDWKKRYFAKYENRVVYAWANGSTSWSSESYMYSWKYTKLIESKECEESKESELEFAWNKWEVDTPILVRDFIYDEWEKRYFAKYEDGDIYAWSDGKTSWTAEGAMTEWAYVKLAESEEGGTR